MRTFFNLRTLAKATLCLTALAYSVFAPDARACDFEGAKSTEVVYFEEQLPKDDLRCDPVTTAKCTAKLKGYLYVPKSAQAGKHPVMIWNHGSSEGSNDACTKAKRFIKEGFVFFAPQRRGHGNSTGSYHRDLLEPIEQQSEVIADAALVPLLLAQMEDVQAAVRYVKKLDAVDDDEVAVMGHSFGGIVSLFAAEHVTGLRAAVDSAGGGLSWDGNDALKAAMKSTAPDVKVPTFLIQDDEECAGDGSDPTKTLRKLLPNNGSDYKIYDIPQMSCGKDGAHSWFMDSAGTDMWFPDVLRFLSKHGVSKS